MGVSRAIHKIPVLGSVYKRNYFAWKRSYFNLLRRSQIKPGPSVVHWLATYRCNAKCVYCEAGANESKCNELITEEIVAVLDDLKSLRVERFFVTGGEPLVRRDMFEVLDHAKRRGMTLGMITNSLLYHMFKDEFRAAGLSSIWTSVDGLEPTHDKNRGVPGAYRAALDAIGYYREIGIPRRTVNTLVHPGNIAELPELLSDLRDAGITRWRLALALPVGRATHNEWALSRQQIQDLFEYAERTRKSFDVELSEELGYLGYKDLSTRNSPFICPSGLTFCVIMPEGSVLPCQVVYDTRYAEGNVRETSFSEIWRNGFGRFRHVALADECASCVHRNACSGGCWGRIVAGGSCLRCIWDPERYGGEDLSATMRSHASRP